MSAPSGLNARDEPVVLHAPTGRGKCQTSQEPIAQGELKVGMVGRSSGVSVIKWMKPKYFAANMRVEYAPTGRAKCTTNHEESAPFIGKGEPRILFRMMKTSCEGTEVAKCQQIYNPANAAVGELVRNGKAKGAPQKKRKDKEDDEAEGGDDAGEGEPVPKRAKKAAAPKRKPLKERKPPDDDDESEEELVD